VATLDELILLMEPVSSDITSPPWGRAIAEVGFEFPDDYKAFVRIYGFGSIDDYLNLVPIYSRPVDLYSGFSGFVRRAEEIDLKSSGDDVWNGERLEFYPNPGGLVLWATDEAGNCYYWSREGGHPNAWPVMLWVRASAEWHRHDGGMVSCLVAILREEFPWDGFVLNPEPDWEHARTSPVWEFYGDWRECP